MLAERGVGGLIEAQEGFLQDGAGRFSQAEKLREVFSEFRAISHLRIKPDEFGEGRLVERVDGGGAFEHGARRGKDAEAPKLSGEEQAIAGPEFRLADKGIEHEFGPGEVIQAVEREAAQAAQG